MSPFFLFFSLCLPFPQSYLSPSLCVSECVHLVLGRASCRLSVRLRCICSSTPPILCPAPQPLPDCSIQRCGTHPGHMISCESSSDFFVSCFLLPANPCYVFFFVLFFLMPQIQLSCIPLVSNLIRFCHSLSPPL